MAALAETKLNLYHYVGYSALEVSRLENYCPRAVTVGLGQCRSSIRVFLLSLSSTPLISVSLGTR